MLSDNPEPSKEDALSREELQKAIRAIIEDPALFCSKLLSLKPFPYQVKFLEDRSARIIVCAGRQVGKPLITAARGVLDYVQSSPIVMRSVIRKTRTMINFFNQSVIRALPCRPYGKMLRGNSADLIIVDESAYVPENIIMDVAMPMLAAKNGTIILISSPCDKKHFFYRVFNSDRWSKYHFKTADNPLVSREFLEEAREEIGESRFRREYLAEFVDDEKTYFPMALLRAAVHVCGPKSCAYCSLLSGTAAPGGDLYAGYDPGGLTDPAVLVVVQRTVVEEPEDALKKKRLVFRVVLSKTFILPKEERRENELSNVYTRFTVKVSEIHQKMGFKRLLVDATGLGSPLVAHCKELKLPAEGLVFSQKTKQENLSNLKILIEQKRVEFPEDLELLSHLNSITCDTTRMGLYTFDHASGTHDDLAYALALALWAARKPSPTIIASKPE